MERRLHTPTYMEDIMAEHIPVENHDPEQEPMYDRHGYQLKVGDNIAYNGGRGRIVEYLGVGTKLSGAQVRVISSTGQRVDLALKLSEAEYRRPDNEEPHSRYGV